MKNSRIYIGLVAFVLAIGGFIAAKANHGFKFSLFSAKFTGSTNVTGTLTLNTAEFTTTSSIGKTVILATAASHTKLATLITTTNSAKVYHN